MIYSFSFLDAEESYPEKARRLFITKDFKRAWTKEKDGGIDIHKMLEQRVKDKTPLPPEAAHFEPLIASFERQGTVEAEVGLGVDHWLNPVGFWGGSGIGHKTEPYIRGKYDVVVRKPQQRAAIIGDWKSGRADYEKELQLEIGALLLMTSDPTIDQVVGMNVYLKTGKPGKIYRFYRNIAPTLWARLLKKVREIDARDAATVWEKRPGPLCPWCPVETCENFQGGQGR